MLLFAFVGALFTGCSSDDDNKASSSKESIIGHWIRYEENGQYLEELGFFADGTCNYTEAFEPDEGNNVEPFYEFARGTYSVKGNELTMRLTFGDETETWTYTINSVKNKNRLVLTDEDGDTYNFDYVEAN